MSRRNRGSVHGFPAALVVCLVVATAVGGALLAPLGASGPQRPAGVALTLSVEGRTLAFAHRGGPALSLEAVEFVVTVDGTPLRHQPPVPFFAARGFRSGPTGPFNAASDDRWEAGERASLTLAGTNRPLPGAGSRVRVRFVADGLTVATATATA